MNKIGDEQEAMRKIVDGLCWQKKKDKTGCKNKNGKSDQGTHRDKEHCSKT